MPTSIEITPEMMREIIMDHYQNPRHKTKPADPKAYRSLHALWDGVACTISSASTDILCDRVIGQDFSSAENTIQQYLNMIEEKPYDASVLDEAIVFMNTGKQAARIHCATMGWTAMRELLEKEEK